MSADPKIKIIVAENAPATLQAMTSAITAMGWTAIPAATGSEVVKLFHRDTPDLVLLDVGMPDIDGLRLLRYLRQDENVRGWVPIILIGAKATAEEIANGIESGADDFLTKPLHKGLLRAKIRGLLRIAAATSRLSMKNHELRHLSASDGLTKLANRRHFDLTLESEWKRTQRAGEEMSVILCDVDHFKKYNDTYGHQMGDTCLVRVAQCLAAGASRPGDLAARYGGEEFVLVLPNTPLANAMVVANRVRAAIEAMDIPHSASSYGRVTISLGVSSTACRSQQPGDLVSHADEALYGAKEHGRNRALPYCPTNPEEST